MTREELNKIYLLVASKYTALPLREAAFSFIIEVIVDKAKNTPNENNAYALRLIGVDDAVTKELIPQWIEALW